LILSVLVYVVNSTLSEGGEEDLSQSVKKIMLNYLQVIALARSFPLRWPGPLVVLFEFQGAVSTLGNHIVNVDCISSYQSGAALFYGKQMMYASIPILTGFVSFAFWFVFGRCKGTPFFKKRENKKVKTPKDKFIVTVTAIIFLMYPTLCGQAFSMFSCRRVGKKLYLEADLEESCYEGQHLLMALTMGVSQLLVYIFGLPMFALYFLRRNHRALSATRHGTHGGLFSNPVVVTRWGLFFKGYKIDRYYWEAIISARKVGVVALSVFGKELGVERQSQSALLLILLSLIFEIMGEPFRETTDAHSILKRLEVSALLVEWGTLWCGLMIYLSGPRSADMNVFMTVCVIVANCFMMIWLVRLLLYAYIEERAAKKRQRKMKKLVSQQSLEVVEMNPLSSISSNAGGSHQSRAKGTTGTKTNILDPPAQILAGSSKRTFMPVDWTAAFTEEGKKYYIDPNKNSQWEKPPGNDNAPAAPHDVPAFF
jgi:hypothetical protein